MSDKKTSLSRPVKKNDFRHRRIKTTDVLKILATGALIYGSLTAAMMTGIRFVQGHLSEWIGTSFGLPHMGRITHLLNEQTDFFQSSLSFSSPSSLGSYLSALSASTAANAKLNVLKALAGGLEGVLSACLTGVLFLGGLFLCLKYMAYCKKRLNRRAATHEIVNELMPILNEINDKLDCLNKKKDL